MFVEPALVGFWSSGVVNQYCLVIYRALRTLRTLGFRVSLGLELLEESRASGLHWGSRCHLHGRNRAQPPNPDRD